MKERDVLGAVLDYLAVKGIFALRMNAGDRFGESNGKKWRIRGHVPGTADVLALPGKQDWAWLLQGVPPRLAYYIVPLWIEVKGPKGEQSELQKSFQADVERRGHSYLLAYSVDDVEKWLKERGV